jgi:hypothetical protein
MHGLENTIVRRKAELEAFQKSQMKRNTGNLEPLNTQGDRKHADKVGFNSLLLVNYL